jgi:hypothetical protein
MAIIGGVVGVASLNNSTKFAVITNLGSYVDPPAPYAVTTCNNLFLTAFCAYDGKLALLVMIGVRTIRALSSADSNVF